MDERINCYANIRRVTSVRTTIPGLSDFGLFYGITQAPGAVADGRPEP
jgi:hypothetical protein